MNVVKNILGNIPICDLCDGDGLDEKMKTCKKCDGAGSYVR